MKKAPPIRIGPKKPVRAFIRERREAAGLTQEQLASRLGTTKGTVSKWETAQRCPSVDTLAAVAEALGIPVRMMFVLPRQDSLDDKLQSEGAEVRREAENFIDYLIRRQK